VFTYHKTGTVLAEQIMRAVGERFGLSVALLSKWRDFLSPAQLREFEQHYGDLIDNLGYRLSNQGGCNARE
jgi:hypothetical protein